MESGNRKGLLLIRHRNTLQFISRQTSPVRFNIQAHFLYCQGITELLERELELKNEDDGSSKLGITVQQ